MGSEWLSRRFHGVTVIISCTEIDVLGRGMW